MAPPSKRLSFECRICAKSFTRRPSELRDGGGKYCGKPCYYKGISLDPGRNSKGGRMVHRGHVLLWMPDHLDAVKGYVREHRYVMEQKLGRRLLLSEDVHHINEDKADNRPENLEILTRSEHVRIHMRERNKDKQVVVKGQALAIIDACKLFGIRYSSFKLMRRSRDWTRQQTADHYAGQKC